MWLYEEFTNTVREEYPFVVLFCGREECPPGYPWGGVRSHYLFHYVLDGQGHLETEHVSREIFKGGGFFLFPGQSHRYQADRKHPWRYIWFGIAGGARTERLFRDIGFTPANPAFDAPIDQQITGWMFSVLDTLKQRTPGYPLRVAGLAYFVFARLTELVPRERLTALHISGDVVEDVKEYIAINYHSRQTTVGRIAEFMGYDQSSIFRKFKKSEGISVQEYLRRKRLREAERLLRETDLAIQRVAACVGMEYVPFYRAFTTNRGITPTRFREINA